MLLPNGWEVGRLFSFYPTRAGCVRLVPTAIAPLCRVNVFGIYEIGPDLIDPVCITSDMPYISVHEYAIDIYNVSTRLAVGFARHVYIIPVCREILGNSYVHRLVVCVAEISDYRYVFTSLVDTNIKRSFSSRVICLSSRAHIHGQGFTIYVNGLVVGSTWNICHQISSIVCNS